MVRIGERFFTSLGFEPLPKTFWERSLFVKPRDREVVCHASAWDIDNVDDLRIKMCIDVNAEDFTTIHHELGHNFYQRAYKHAAGALPRQRQRRLPRSDRRHARALGHARVPGEDRICSTRRRTRRPTSVCCCARALERLAFLPFGLLVDQWRWQVFSGDDHAGELQQGVVGPEAEVPGRRAAVAARRGVLRSRREVSRAGEHARTRATSSRRSCSSSSTARWPRRPAARRRCTAARSTATRKRAKRLEGDAGDGRVEAVARRARSADRPARDGRHRDGRLLRAAQGSGSTSRMRGKKSGLVTNSKLQTPNFKGVTATSTFWSLEFEV